jgi:hypothetical protein
MTHLWSEGEPIRMEEETTGSGEEARPVRFLWGGRWRVIRQIVQRWQVDSDWWSSDGRVWRDYMAAITNDGLLVVVYFDHLTSEWRLAKLYD